MFKELPQPEPELVVYIVEQYDAQLAEISQRIVFGNLATAEKYIQSKIKEESASIERDDPGIPLILAIDQSVGPSTYYSLESEGDEYIGFYLTPARFWN